MQSLTDKDIAELSDSFSRRTANNRRIVFGIHQTKKLRFLLHWVQNVYRVLSVPSIATLDEVTFTAALNRAGARADVRALISTQSEHRQKEASPGPLVSENK